MKFLFVLASAAIAAASVEAAAPERTSWYYPFWRQSCTGCTAAGNALPWCVKVPAQNIICPIGGKATPVLSCLRVGYASVAGKAATATTATTAAGLTASASVPASQVTCTDSTISTDCIDSITASVFPDGALPSSVTVDAGQVSGTLSPTVSIPGSQVTGALSSTVTINGIQVTGAVATANNLQCPANATAGSIVLPSCYAINGTQIVGNIPAGQLSGTVGNSVVFNGTMGDAACSNIESNCLSKLTVQFAFSSNGTGTCASFSGTGGSVTIPVPTAQCPVAGTSPIGNTAFPPFTQCPNAGSFNGVSCTGGSWDAPTISGGNCVYTCSGASGAVCTSPTILFSTFINAPNSPVVCA